MQMEKGIKKEYFIGWKSLEHNIMSMWYYANFVQKKKKKKEKANICNHIYL